MKRFVSILLVIVLLILGSCSYSDEAGVPDVPNASMGADTDTQ